MEKLNEVILLTSIKLDDGQLREINDLVKTFFVDETSCSAIIPTPRTHEVDFTPEGIEAVIKKVVGE